MYHVDYYLNRRGERPVAKWLDNVFKTDVAGASRIDAQIQKLREHGLKLLNTNMMKHIIGEDNHLYELIPGAYRVVVYYDSTRSKFILLHGFRKTKRVQTRDIARARRNLQEYLSMSV